MRNTPYVKQFDSNGELSNPIEGKLVNEFLNRQQRKPKKTDYSTTKKELLFGYLQLQKE